MFMKPWRNAPKAEEEGGEEEAEETGGGERADDFPAASSLEDLKGLEL